MDALVAQGQAEVPGHGLLSCAQDEVDDLDRGVDDAECVGALGQVGLEELVVQLDDDLLASGVVVDALGPHSHRVIEALQVLAFGFESLVAECSEHALHGLGDRVVLGERVGAEESVEDRLGDDVLGEHVDGVGLADTRVDHCPQLGDELRERGPLVRQAERGLDPCHVRLGDGGDVLCPLLPVGALADLVDQPGVDGLAPVVDPEQGHLDVLGGLGLLLRDALRLLPRGCVGAVLVADRLVAWAHVPDADVLWGLVVQPDLVDRRVEPVVVRPQGLEHLPDGLEPLVVSQRLRRRHARRHGDRQDDVPVRLAFGAAHDPADGLDDIHDRVARVQEQHRVQAWHVHALGQCGR
jgi:hypothetical protein